MYLSCWIDSTVASPALSAKVDSVWKLQALRVEGPQEEPEKARKHLAGLAPVYPHKAAAKKEEEWRGVRLAEAPSPLLGIQPLKQLVHHVVSNSKPLILWLHIQILDLQIICQIHVAAHLDPRQLSRPYNLSSRRILCDNVASPPLIHEQHLELVTRTLVAHLLCELVCHMRQSMEMREIQSRERMNAEGTMQQGEEDMLWMGCRIASRYRAHHVDRR
jgi:hypothetical protein